MRFFWGFITALILIGLAAVAVTYSGTYNVAANVPDIDIFNKVLSTNMRRSVVAHAKGITPPAQLTDQQARDGFRIYNEACVYCHGGPGKDPGDIGKGLNPEPPYLPDTVGTWTSAQLFWIVKNGVKMTGMGSYGATHKDDEIWNIVAFLQRLPKMTPEQYKLSGDAAAGGNK